MIAALLMALGLLAGPALAGADAPCRTVEHRERSWTVCTATLPEHRVELHLEGADGAVLGGWDALEAEAGEVLFAMNGGMYHEDRRPVGLYLEDGAEVAGIVTSDGPGNFGMLPNGVLCIADEAVRVIESRAYAAAPPACRDATQSGPMLVIDGALHPRFLPDSEFTNLRNGVGATPDGRTVHFVISDQPVTFHEMATLFRDVLGVRDALYLDGRVSRLWAPSIGRRDPGRRMGPIVSVQPAS